MHDHEHRFAKLKKPGVDSSILSLGMPKPLHSKDHSRHLQEVFGLTDESGESAQP